MITLEKDPSEHIQNQPPSLDFVNAPAMPTSSAPPVSVSFSTTMDESEQHSVAIPSFLRGAKHPGVCMAHLIFKATALVSFIFGSFIFGGWKGDYVFTFVVTTIFLSLDFWTVKNISGRILVGMRWWNDIKEDGSSEWVYESAPETRHVDSTDKTVFWTALYLWPLCWCVFLIIYIFRLDLETCLLVILGLVLSGANLVGYWKCSNDQKKRVAQWASSTAFRAVLGNIAV